MKKVAVFGSRKWPDILFAVEERIDSLGECIIVTTEAEGACTQASEYAIKRGLPVIVFKPVKLNDADRVDEYGVEEWRIAPNGSTIVHHNVPTWADWQSACNYRSLLMVERAHEGFAFQAANSRGTQFEIELFEMQGKPCEVEKH